MFLKKKSIEISLNSTQQINQTNETFYHCSNLKLKVYKQINPHERTEYTINIIHTPHIQKNERRT